MLLFIEYIIRYHHLLSNLVQKYIVYKFWETVSDKEYIIDYYKYKDLTEYSGIFINLLLFNLLLCNGFFKRLL